MVTKEKYRELYFIYIGLAIGMFASFLGSLYSGFYFKYTTKFDSFLFNIAQYGFIITYFTFIIIGFICLFKYFKKKRGGKD